MKEKIRKVVDVSDLNSLLESSEGLPITLILEHEGKDTELYCTGAFSTAGGRAVVLEFVKDRPEKTQRAYMKTKTPNSIFPNYVKLVRLRSLITEVTGDGPRQSGVVEAQLITIAC